MNLQTPIENLYMIGNTYAKKLQEKLGIYTLEDLLYHFPFRYDDLTKRKQISDLIIGETVTLQGQILSIQNIRTRYGKQIQKAVFTDGENTMEITWFNQPYLIQTFTKNPNINLAGKVATFAGKKTLTSPKYELLRSNYVETGFKPVSTASTITPTTTHTGRLVPIYPETYGVSSKWLRSRIKPIIKEINQVVKDWLPVQILNEQNFLTLPEAIKNIHFPNNSEILEKAINRLAFDEAFLLQLVTQLQKKAWHENKLRHTLQAKFKDLEPFLKSLPFKLTQDQINALKDIINDFNKDKPMNRLLEGDVGSGKTVVAAAAIYLSFLNKTKAILMAPTEVLAIQHHNSLKTLLEPLGIKIGFFTGSNKSKEKFESYDLYLGTHALLFQNLPQEKISLVIIDEQHRFGVSQRAKIIGENIVPHVLSMTATPIPRTAALTLYGNLSLSLIKEMPKGRKKIKTWVVPNQKRKDGHKWIEEKIIKEKTQAYFIYPLIDPSDKGTMKEVKAVTEEYEKLKKIFPNLKIGLIHGKLKSKEKNKIMQKFADGKIDILASTTVIEVGIDVANASIIVIHSAERFGLAQLHQLRGRVGRGAMQSYCLLFTTNTQDNDKKRLKALEQNHSGIELAEIDLKLRGPGQITGIAQSGFLNLKFASIHDKDLITKTYHYAQKYLDNINRFPLLQEKLYNSKITNIKPN